MATVEILTCMGAAQVTRYAQKTRNSEHSEHSLALARHAGVRRTTHRPSLFAVLQVRISTWSVTEDDISNPLSINSLET
jgi:hypothetical protein